MAFKPCNPSDPDRSMRRAFSQCGCGNCLFMLRLLDAVPAEQLPEMFEAITSMNEKSSSGFACQSTEFH